MVLTNNAKTKTNKNRVDRKKQKQDKYLVYNWQHSFAQFKDLKFNELSLDSMYKRLNDFERRFNRLKNVTPQIDNNKVLKQKVLDGVGDLFNELYYIYKDKYSEEKDGLNARYKKNFNYKKLQRLTDDYQYEPEEEKQQTSKKEPPKKPDKKEPPKKPSKVDLRKSNEWINKKEAGINSELFQKYFKLQKPSNTLKVLYTTNNKRRKTVI